MLYLKHRRLSLCHERNPLAEPMRLRALAQPPRGLFHGLVTEAECAVVHGDHLAGFQIQECLHGLLGIHVDLAPAGRVVRSNGHEGDINGEALADFLEAVKIGGIAAMKNGPPSGLDNEAAKPAVRVVQHPRAPMMTRGQCDLDRSMAETLPVMQLVDAAESEVVDEISDLERDDDWLILGDLAEGLAVEVIEMGVGDEDEIDLREIVQLDAGMLDALDDFEPLGPIWIDEDIDALCLDQKRGVADPCQADLAILEVWKQRIEVGAEALGKEGGDENLGEEIALVPAFFGPQADLACIRGGATAPGGGIAGVFFPFFHRVKF
jgi:hypothetical protein